MQNQQLKFSLVFICLGAFLGWFSNSAFDKLQHKKVELVECKANNESSPLVLAEQKKANVVTIDSLPKQFSKLLKSQQYPQALSLFKRVKVEQKQALTSILINKINQMLDKSEPEIFNLLDVFLQEFYDNSSLLLFQANAYVKTKQLHAALDSYLLAISYAKDNEQYIEINQLIHDFSSLSFEQFKADNNLQQSIVFFEKLIEKDAQFAFYHLAIAESYIKNHEKQVALMHLQLITADPRYGLQASELLERLFVDKTTDGIKLEAEGEHYVVNTIVADIYPIKLMIDTGASYSSLSSYTLAQLVREQLAKKIGQSTIYTAGGKVEADIYELKKIAIDGFSVNSIRVVELDLQSPDNESDNNKASNFEGLLGVNFLNEFNFSIDPQSKRLFLSPKI